MNRRQMIIISVTSIFLVLLILVGLTYAYFLTQIKGNTNERSISVSTADLKLEYGDGNGLISAVNVIPGVYVTGNDGKTFTVENKGNATVENYGIFLTELVNDLADTSDLVYTLTCVSKNVQTNEVSGTCNGVSSETEFPTNNSLLVTNDIGVGIRHEYRLDVLFKETNTDQSDNMNKTIRAKIDLYALAGTIDIEGTVTGYQNGDYIVVNSAEPKKTIIEETETEGVGYYKVVGLLPDNHTITLYDSENTSKASTTFILNKAQSAGVSGNTITMTDETRSATIDLTFNAGNLTKEISQTLEDYNPYPFNKGTLAYAILDSATKTLNGTTYREMPLTIPGREVTMLYNDGGVSQSQSSTDYVQSRSVRNPYINNIYYTYGDTISYENGLYTITNKDGSELQAVLLSEEYKTLKGKYIVSSEGSNSQTPVSGANKGSVYYVYDTSYDQVNNSGRIYYIQLYKGCASNELYITYGDSYELDRKTGYYSIFNQDGSELKTVKYNEGYNSVLVDKYIASVNGSYDSTPYSYSNSTIYKVTNSSTATKIAYKSITKSSVTSPVESTLSITNDNYGTSYYYRGNVEDNYVNFAGMCFRIVRIEGDGSIKLILEDQDQTCESADGNWNIPTETGGEVKTGNFGYDDLTYTVNKKYIVGDYLNPKPNSESTSQQFAYKNFQNGPLKNYLSKLKSGDWCYDDKAYDTNWIGDILYFQEIFNRETYYRNHRDLYYGTYSRFHSRSVDEVTLECYGTIFNKFNDNSEMYVAALTGEELAFAGGGFAKNDYYYLVNNYQRNNNLNFWSMSLATYYIGIMDKEVGATDEPVSLLSDGRYEIYNFVYNDNVSFRPAIQLKSGTNISGGVGTKANPYVIQ